MPHMAEFADPLDWGTGAIGFDVFRPLPTPIYRAAVVLVSLSGIANPHAILKLCCVSRSIQELVDCSNHMISAVPNPPGQENYS